MKRTWLFFFLIILLSHPRPMMGQDEPSASVEVEVDRSEITIGDRIEYRMHIQYDPGVEIQKPGWGEGLESFQILDFHRGNPKMVEDRWETTDVYTLSTFTPEDYIIPPVQVPIKLPTGATQVLETQPITIQVASVLPDDETTLELKDIRGPVPVYSGISWTRIAIAAGIVLALVLLGLLIWYLRRDRVEPLVIEPPRPEHEIAFERLRGLRESVEEYGPTPDPATCKTFGLELSEILREYLENRLDIIALEMTTEELGEHFEKAPLGRGSSEVSDDDRVMEILSRTDLLKFAKGTDSKEQLLDLISVTEKVIDSTKRIRVDLIGPADETREAA